MATKQFLDLNGLSQYHDLITEYIGTEDAKSIKSISVSGNTVSFFKTADGSGTAAYTVNLPDVSGFMEKIANASGDKVVMSNSDGSVSEGLGIASGSTIGIVTGYFPDGTSHGNIPIFNTFSDSSESTIIVSEVNIDDVITTDKLEDALAELDVVTGYFEPSGEQWSDDEIVLGAGAGGATLKPSGVYISDLATTTDLADKIDKIANATGGKIATTTASGEVAESGTAIADLAQIGASGFTTGYIVTADSNGKLQATTDPSDFINNIAGATGGKIVTSTNDGQVAESNTAISDLATQTDLADKIDKPESFQGDYFLMSHDDGEGNFEIVEGFHLAADQSEGLLTGYFDNPQPNEILIFNQFGTTDGIVQSSGVNVNDIMTKIDSASGDKLVVSTSGGGVEEFASLNIGDVSSENYELLQIYDLGSSYEISNSGLISSAIVTTGYDLSSADGVVLVGSAGVGNNNGIAPSSLSINDIMHIISGATGSKVVSSSSDGSVFESELAISDIATLDYIGTIPQGSSATDVIGYIDEVAGDVGDDMEVTLVEAQTPTTGYLKTYELYQGGNAAANLVGKIDIPKDLVVTSGEIVVNPTGQPAGTYLKLTIANQTAPVYINVADLCDVYTAASGAAQVQLAISATNEISATLVAGGVGTTELAANAVTTQKIADDAVTADKVAISAHTEAQTAGADGLAISVTSTDGQISAVSGSIASGTYLKPADVGAIATADIQALFA